MDNSLTLNLEKRSLSYKGISITLPPQQFKIISLLHSDFGGYVRTREIRQSLYKDSGAAVPSGNGIRVQINTLRKKIRNLTDGEFQIQSRYNYGYRLKPSDS